MLTIEFKVLGKAEPAGSKKAVPLGKGGRWGVVDANKHAKAWKETVGKMAMIAMNGRPPLEGPVKLSLFFTIERPKTHLLADGVSRSALGRTKTDHISAPDVLKLARAVEDGMTGVVYLDDGQIVEEHLSKRYGDSHSVTVLVEEWA